MLAQLTRIWPLAGLALGLVISVAWMGLIGYGLLKLL
jgi:dolichyl-phosphate-mannose--protein O-mannosyl transferase